MFWAAPWLRLAEHVLPEPGLADQSWTVEVTDETARTPTSAPNIGVGVTFQGRQTHFCGKPRLLPAEAQRVSAVYWARNLPVQDLGVPLQSGWQGGPLGYVQVFSNRMTEVPPNAARPVWVMLFVQGPVCASSLVPPGPCRPPSQTQKCVSVRVLFGCP